MASVCLAIIDGWGICDVKEGNAIFNAETPVMDKLTESHDEYITLDASGEAVGLPNRMMGNSEVGHMNIGCGRVVQQDIVRINNDIENKMICKNKKFIECTTKASLGNGRLHLIGLLSEDGIHAHIEHLFALLEAAKQKEVPNTYIHSFIYGLSGYGLVQSVLNKVQELDYGKLSTVMGHYYAMNRNNIYDRTKIAYEGLVQGIGENTTKSEVVQLIKKRYEDNSDTTDGHLKPLIVDDRGLIKDNDTLIFYNFRADCMRQITEAFGLERHFKTIKVPQNLEICTMTKYKEQFPFTTLYPRTVPVNVLSEWLSKKGLAQFHCAESVKYGHVTYFFAGGREESFYKEDRLIIDSPKVNTYDLKPEMSSQEVANAIVEVIDQKKYRFVICNFAPPDVLGHTGKYEAAIKAVEATDKAIGLLVEACKRNDFVLLVTADHGNVEKMIGDDGSPNLTHTTNRVPFCIKGSKKLKEIKYNAALCDVAPTILAILELEQPSEMTGRSLLA